jgi:hypothetical protein
MYDFIYNMVKCQESTASKAKINKEARIIPNLVFQVERLEGLLIKAAKATKQDFLRHLRRGTSRDFRIDIGKLMESDDREPSAANRYFRIRTLTVVECVLELILLAAPNEFEQIESLTC